MDAIQQRFEDYVKSTFLMHERMLIPGPGRWEYQENYVGMMLDAFKAGIRSEQEDPLP